MILVIAALTGIGAGSWTARIGDDGGAGEASADQPEMPDDLLYHADGIIYDDNLPQVYFPKSGRRVVDLARTAEGWALKEVGSGPDSGWLVLQVGTEEIFTEQIASASFDVSPDGTEVA